MEDKAGIVGCIICEETKREVEFKIQSENKNGFVIAEGILQEGNEINRNKRFYPTEELRMGIMNPRQQELVTSGNLKGEAGHPLDKSLVRQQKVDPINEQVWYTKLWMDGNFVMAHFRGTNNDLGRSFNDDLKDGQKPSFSLRALGSLVNENGRMTVRNMQPVTWDRVYFPSHSKAYTTKIITSESAGSEENLKQYIVNPRSHFKAKESEINSICESGNAVTGDEWFVTPLTQHEVNNFILSESVNLRTALNTFDIFYESIELDPDMYTVSMKTRLGDTIHLSLETALSREIINGISNLY